MLVCVATAGASAQSERLQTIGEELSPTCESVDTTANNTTGNDAVNNDSVKSLAGSPPKARTPCDSKLTPVERPSDLWEQIAGARYMSDASIRYASESATSFADDFYTVAFRNPKLGFFAGSTCREGVPAELQSSKPDAAQSAALREYVGGCDRVPVIYSYTNADGEGVAIKEIWRGDPGTDPGGFVAAIGWIDENTALAVGGTGTYPRREVADPTTPANDPAGDARVWQFARDPKTGAGSWRELRDLPDGTPGDEIPDQMRGMNALAVWPGGDFLAEKNPVPEGSIAYAGGFRQLWEWRRGQGFVQAYTNESPGSVLNGAPSFRFRIRGINFQQVPLNALTASYSFPYAVTAGCCAQNPAHNFPRVLANRQPGQWFVADLDSEQDIGTPQPQSYYGLGANGPTVLSADGPGQTGDASEGASVPAMIWEPTAARNDPTGAVDPVLPDSLGAVGAIPQLGDFYPREGPGVRTGRPKDLMGRVNDLRSFTGSARLVAVDDWRSQPTCNADKSNCTFFSFVAYARAVGAQPSGQAAVQEFDSRELSTGSTGLLQPSTSYKLSSYQLNAIDAMDFGGVAFAAGDHGALVRFGDSSPLAVSEPAAPRLGQRGPSRLSDRTAYEQSRAGAEKRTGELPSLGEIGFENLSEPALVPAAATDLGFTNVKWMVMSRDGQEGFAAADGRLYHYDGLLWEPCRDQGPLAERRCEGAPSDSRAATRVPLENDGNPTNDDQFELAALAGDGLYRYNHGGSGRWEREMGTGLPTTSFTSIAFTAPNDGWAIRGPGAVSDLGSQWGRQWPTIFRFNGDRWVNCEPFRNGITGAISRFQTQTKCADWNDRLPYGTAESANSSMGIVGAGDRLYLYGTRAPAEPNGGPDPGGRRYPMVVYRDGGEPCAKPGDDGCWHADGGGWDPGFGNPPAAPRGRVRSLSVVSGPDGYEGWAAGEFEDGAKLARLTPDGSFEPWPEAAGNPVNDYGLSTNQSRLVSVAGQDGRAFAISANVSGNSGLGPLLMFSPNRERWELLPLPFPTVGDTSSTVSYPKVLAPDNQGGLWVAAEGYFYHYTDRAPAPVFVDAPHPIQERVTSAAASLDGTFWVATATNGLYRYDRIGGWERIPIRGWDPGRFQASPSPVNALAVGPDGSGIAVGPGGRIARLSADEVTLDDAAGVLCSETRFAPPCGTSRDLVSAAVAPDGSAMIGGAARALLWRPAGGEFRLIGTPEVGHSVTFTSISMPSAARAYLATDSGGVFAGELSAGGWRWRLENVDGSGDLLTRKDARRVAPVRSVAVDAHGHGYAVAEGILLERIPGDDSAPWRPLDVGYEITGAAISPSPGATDMLVGEGGLVLARDSDTTSISRIAEPWDPLSVSSGGLGRSAVVGLGLLPGLQDGQIEAWVVLSKAGRTVILHHPKDTTEPLLNVGARAAPLRDSPHPRDGEVVFAAFGKSDCPQPAAELPCAETTGSRQASHLFPQRIVDEIIAAAAQPDGPQFALFTGDINDATTDYRDDLDAGADHNGGLEPPATSSIKQSRWRELIADRLTYAGIPLFGAVGGQDLSTTEFCFSPWNVCRGTRDVGGAGTNVAWQAAMGPMPKPWGLGEPVRMESLAFEPVPDSLGASTGDSFREDDPAGGELDGARSGIPSELPQSPHPLFDPSYNGPRDVTGQRLRSVTANVPSEDALHGARTHYAFDLVDTSSELKRARVVVVDTALRGLTASDPIQNPVEPQGQAGWLEEVLCIDGGPDDTDSSLRDCTREPGEPAIVLSNTPTYSYGPGYLNAEGRFALLDPARARGGDTQIDAAAFEAILMRHDVSVVVSGRIGWNALYWALAPGLHEPCPGEGYPDQSNPPKAGAQLCGRETEADPADTATGVEKALAGSEAPLPAQARDALGASGGNGSSLPFVISSSAGGVLAEPSGDASNGFWRGYAIVRVSPDGNPAKTIVEQRPILDWVEISATEHSLEPGQRLTLQGMGREPATLDGPFRYDDIDTAAITHRYDLLLADPNEPWLPCLDSDPDCEALAERLARVGIPSDRDAASARPGSCGSYICLDPKIGTIEDQTGEVKAGNGRYPDTFAIALLSVGDHSATWPLVFKRSPSFVVNPAVGAPLLPGAPASSGSAPQPPTPPNPAAPDIPQASAPSVPALPSVAPLSAGEPPEPQPPAPPSPPPPAEQQSPLDLTVSPTAITVATPSAVIQPPTPPVNPAPPSGARREARQRQAATQKSGADSTEGSQELGGDTAQAPPSANPGAFTRYEQSFSRYVQDRPEPSFTPLTRPQASASSAGALYAGGLTLLAATLALGFTTLRAGPRRRPPEVPSPAWSVSQFRRG